LPSFYVSTVSNNILVLADILFYQNSDIEMTCIHRHAVRWKYLIELTSR
jgi:hypothetical protein